MKDQRRRVTPERSHELLQIYLHMGDAIAERDCVEAGVSAMYASHVAHEAGLGRRFKVRGSGNVATRVRHDDPRWRWAVERGTVIA
jgi:hypothetical protein